MKLYPTKARISSMCSYREIDVNFDNILNNAVIKRSSPIVTVVDFNNTKFGDCLF